jgi:hypothetical protein
LLEHDTIGEVIMKTSSLLGILALGFVAPSLWAQAPSSDSQPAGGRGQMTQAQLVAEQQKAMSKIDALNGVWRGSGWTEEASGRGRVQFTATVRVGPFLDGAVKVIELRQYTSSGELAYHGFNTVAYEPQRQQYVMAARANGRAGQFPFHVTPDGYMWIWEIGPGRGVRRTGAIKDNEWTETTDTIRPNQAEPTRTGEFTVRRISATDWPEGGALTLK